MLLSTRFPDKSMVLIETLSCFFFSFDNVESNSFLNESAREKIFGNFFFCSHTLAIDDR